MQNVKIKMTEQNLKLANLKTILTLVNFAFYIVILHFDI
jgi:hypothetical protein